MFGTIKNRCKALCVATAALLLTLQVQAASILPADIETTFSDAKADMVKIIGFAFALVLVVVSWKHIRSAAR